MSFAFATSLERIRRIDLLTHNDEMFDPGRFALEKRRYNAIMRYS